MREVAGRDARLPFTVLLPDTSRSPIEIHDHSVGLRMVLVEKQSVHFLSSEWDVPGVYLLLDPVQADGTFGVYVGKAPAGIRARLKTHERGRSWARALLIQRATLHGLTSAHAGWLEGDLYGLFLAAERATLHNTLVPGDDTVPSYDLRTLESFRDPIVRVLRLLGYDPESSDDNSGPRVVSKRGYTFHGVTIAELINAGLLQAGDQLLSVNGSWPASAEVNADGTIFCNGHAYSSPSSAASAVKGGAANGWDFWAAVGVGTSTLLSVLREQFREASKGGGSNA
jgi:hypothetical protein